jgi:hypothetical protein
MVVLLWLRAVTLSPHGGLREESRPSGRSQLSIKIDDEDRVELDRIARAKRSTLGQVIREFIVAGIERERRLQAVEVA